MLSSPPKRRSGSESMPPSDLVGHEFGGRYRVEGKLGAGGIGIVYRAVDARLSRPVALKVLREAHGMRRPQRRRFEREAKVLASLTHPNVVTIIDYGVADGVPYLVMELLEGETLADALERQAPLPVARACGIMRQLLLGLGYVHEQGLVHRDLKPGNVFLQRLPELGEHVKLLDFGLAKFLEAHPDDDLGTVTRSGEIFGTPGYMPPEQWVGQSVNARSDVYSAAAVFFEMLGGCKPFAGQAQEVLRNQLVQPPSALHEACRTRVAHPELEAVLQRALAKDPELRFADAAAFAAAIQSLPEPLVYEGHEATDARRQAAAAVSKRSPDAAPGAGEANAPTERLDSNAAQAEAAARAAHAALAPTIAQVAAAPPRRGAWAQLQSAAQRLLRRVLVAGALTVSVASVLVIGAALAVILMLRSPRGDGGSGTLDDALPSALQNVLPEALRGGTEGGSDGSASASQAEVAARGPGAGAADEAAAASQRPRAANPWRRATPRSLRKLRTAIGKGSKGSERTITQLRRYNREHPSDPRGHLLLAGLYMNRGWLSDAASQYEFAYLRDASSRGDPRMLGDLLQLTTHPATHRQAGKLVTDIYGREALDAVGRAIARASEPASRTRLTALRDALARAEN